MTIPIMFEIRPLEVKKLAISSIFKLYSLVAQLNEIGKVFHRSEPNWNALLNRLEYWSKNSG